jgi:hypothetical protein
MKVKMERQLNFLLPISNNKTGSVEFKVAKPGARSVSSDTEKRYMQIKESLRNKGLIKSS